MKSFALVLGLIAAIASSGAAQAYTIDYTVGISGETHMSGSPPGSASLMAGSGTAQYDSVTQVLTMLAITDVTVLLVPGTVIQLAQTLEFSGTQVGDDLTGVSQSTISETCSLISGMNVCALMGTNTITGISDIPLLGGSFSVSQTNSNGPLGTMTYTLAAIPEPGTALLMGLGLAGLAVRPGRRA